MTCRKHLQIVILIQFLQYQSYTRRLITNFKQSLMACQIARVED